MDLFTQVFILFIFIVVGYIVRKLNIIKESAALDLSGFILNISLPALILNSLQRDFSKDLLKDSGLVLAISFGMYLLSFLIAVLWVFLIRLPKKERGVHLYALIFSNVGFMGFPVVAAAFGPEALFYLAIFNVPFNLLAFSLGAWLLARTGKRPLSLNWRTFINPSVVATVLGFLAFLFSLRFPPIFSKVLAMLGDLTSPLSMVLIGAVLADTSLALVFGRWRVYLSALARLLLIPSLVFLVMRLFRVDGILAALPVLVSTLPPAANTTILATYYEADSASAAALVFLGTLASVLTVPLLAYVFF